MKGILLILPIVAMAMPEIACEPVEPFKNGTLPVVVPKRTSLDDILKAYNIQDVENRIPRRVKRSCLIEKHHLKELAQLLKTNHKFVPSPNQSKLTVDRPVALAAPESGTPCDVAKAKLLTNVDTLTTVYVVMLINGATLNEEEFYRLKKMYENVHGKFHDDFKIIKETADPDIKRAVEEVLQEKTALEDRLDQIVSDIQYNITIQKILRENQIDLIVSEIYTGKYEEAKKTFLEVGQQDLTIPIVEKMARKPNNENLLKFIKALPWLLHRMIGYEAMLKKGNLGSSILTMEYDFLELLNYTNDPNIVRESQPIINSVRTRINEEIKGVLEAWAIKISTKKPNEYNDVIKYADTQLAPFDAHLEDLVEKVYDYTGNDENVIEKILLFSDALTKIPQSARTYIKLYNLMIKNQDVSFTPTLKIGFKVLELTGMNHFKNIDEKDKIALNELKEQMPEIIRAIAWGQICLKNEKLGVFLNSNGPYENNRRKVGIGSNGESWDIQAVDNGDAFRMIHVPTVECFYAESDELAYGPTKRRLFTSQKVCSKLINPYWKLEDANWREGKFFIKNVQRNEYLCGEEVKEEAPAGGDITNELDTISKKNAALADKIKQWLAASGKTDRLQAFTWRRRSRCQNPTWLVIESSKC